MVQALFQQARLIDPVTGIDEVGDLLVEDGVIAARAPKISPPDGAEVHDCQGLIIGPGLVELYSQSGEPGHEQRETLASLTAAATAGGFSRVALLPNRSPAIDNPAQLARQQAFRTAPNQAQLYFWGALTLGTQGQQMSELLELADSGAVGFSDGQPIDNLALVRRLLDYLHPPLEIQSPAIGPRPIALWARDRNLASNGVAREGSLALQLGLPGDPEISETSPLAGLIECVRASGTPIHCMRISTARGVELLRRAKEDQLPITASVSWMHLLFSTADLESYDPCLRLSPPLGNPADQQALREAVASGLIDAIAIDHCPHTYEDKTVAFGTAPPGAIGLEFALPILWKTFVTSGLWPARILWERLSCCPAQCLNQDPPSLAAGQSEWLIFDPNAIWTAQPQTIESLSVNSFFVCKEINGKVQKLHAI